MTIIDGSLSHQDSLPSKHSSKMPSPQRTDSARECSKEQEGTEVENYDENVDDGFLDIDLGDGCLPPQTQKVYIRSSAPYIADQGRERYHGALRSLIPVRRKNIKKDDIGVDQAGLFSFIFCTWMSKLMYKGHRKGLTIQDIPQCSPYDCCDHNVQRLEMFWQEEIRNHGPSGASLYRAVWRFSRTRIITDCLAFTVSCILGFVTPLIFMRKLLEFAENSEANFQEGFTWAVMLMLSELCRIMFVSWRWVIAFRTAGRLRAACLGLMYKKLIRLNHFEEKSMGQIINIFANDSQRIFDMIVFGPMFIGGPLVLICGIVYVLHILGPWALSGILVFVAFYPVQYSISRLSGLLRGKTVQISDQRVSLMSEILMYIKTIKMNAWEESFENQIYKIRSNEQRHIAKTSYLTTLGISLAPTVPIISAVVTFMAHIGSGNTLTAAQAFPIQAFFSYCVHCLERALQNGLTSLYNVRIGLRRVQAFPFVTVMITLARNFINITNIGLINTFEACVGLKRIQRCLLIDEVQSRIQRPIDRAQAVSIGGATFSWGSNWCLSIPKTSRKGTKKNLAEKVKKSDLEAAIDETEKLKTDGNQFESSPVLQEINFCAPKGHLVGICGPVGAGKTSLLLAILGQMRLIRGQLARDGTCAYVSQQAWITNGTLRDNIVFGESFLSSRYYKVVNICALNDDLNRLPGGDLTEIGERGMNLSGGQKQRVALARALYTNKDIYLLDDPLSAVDVHVGVSIFENYIQGELRNKTVVLVTHQTQLLSHCDEVYVMKDGRITEHGTHEELLKLDQHYASMVKQMSCDSPSQTSCAVESSVGNGAECASNLQLNEPKPDKERANANVGRDEDGKLTVDEPANLGSLKTDTYFSYMSAAGGYLVAAMVFCVFLANVGSTAFSSWWLATWIKAGGGNATVELNNVTVTSPNLADNPDFGFYQAVYGSTIFLILLTCGLRCLMFTKATMQASSKLHKELFQKVLYSPMLFFESNPIGRLQNLFSRDMDEVDSRLPSTVENIINSFWTVAFAILFICIVFPWFFVAFIPLSMMYYFLSRIFRKGIRDLKCLENSTRSPVLSSLVETLQGLNTIHAFNKEGDYIQRFFQLYDENATCNYLWNVGMRWLAVRVDLLAAATMSITAFLVVILHGAVAPAMAGLAMAYSWHISGVLQYTTRLISETEVRFISVERMLAYVESTVAEGNTKCTKPPPSWPNQGLIRFQNVSLSYRQNLPNILHNVSFNILSGEKIGIVGRTGSGKTSLSVALFRLAELSNGRIKLDGLDISEVPLSILRSKISIIPQDPVLFSGTIRSNLDCANKYTDEDLWEVLNKAKLSDRVNAMPLKLNTAVGSGSSGLSVGECQLMCLARALLENSKVLILDEATASIDPGTEAAVQSTIQKEFDACTILIIAHRLSTVTNCNRVMVMDEGKVVEFDSPDQLLAKPDSLFARMMASADTALKT